jgi:nicotinamidase-related amidase
VVRLYQPDGSNVDLCRRARVEAGWEVLRPGTPGCELLPEVLRTPETRLDPSRLLAGELQPLGAHEWALYKPRWGAFFATRLDPHLRALQADTLVFAGSNYPNCPRASIYEASERDYRIVVVTDGVSGLDWRGGRELAAIGVALRTSDQVSEAWRDGAPIRRPRERHGAR